MNNDEKQNCQNQDKHVKNTESFSTVKSALKPTPRKCVQLGGNLIQIRHRNNTNKAKYKHKRNWKRFLPSWLRRAGRAGKVAAIEAAVTSRPTRVQICKQEQTSMQNGYHIMDHGSIEKNRTNKPSYERLISNYNFDEVNSEHKTSCERCKQKGRTVCGKHSSAIESGSRSSRPIHVGVASVSSDRTKAKTSNQSCSCSERRNKQPPKCPIRISSNHSNSCEPCKEKRTSTTSLCQESLLGQLRTYLQKLTSAHKISCQRCNSNASSSCKVSLLEQAREYLMSLFSNHQSGCQRCKQKDTTSYLETILQQAWSYLQKIGSDQKIGCQRCKQKDRPTTADLDNNCCQHCLERGMPICCIHSPGKDVHKSSSQGCKSNTKPVCSKQYASPPSQGILKYSSTHSTCSCSKDSLQEYAKKLANRADEVFRDYKSCPKVCLKKPSQESIKPEPRCKSTEVSKKPYCQYSSEGAQPVLIGSSHGSYCSLQAIVEPRKSCSGECKPSQSVEVPQDDPCKKHSSPTQSCNSNTNCAEPCQQEGQQEDGSNRPKTGLSLTMEPTDHKFCGRPEQCKHSRQASPSESAKSCTLPICTGACKSSEQDKAVPVHSPSCEGGCSNCVPPMHRKNCMVDAQYEAFLDEQFGRTVARQLLDKETLCRNGCDCMTCINRIQHSKPASSGDVKLSSEAHWKIPLLTL